MIDMALANNLTDGYALSVPNKTHYVFYKEGSASVQIDLSGMSVSQPAVAIDTKSNYVEIDLGRLSTSKQTWDAPYASDCAIAVGDFGQKSPPLSVPSAPTGEQLQLTRSESGKS